MIELAIFLLVLFMIYITANRFIYVLRAATVDVYIVIIIIV